MPDNQQVGLFLGAGASFELGMPTYLASHRRVQRLFYVCPFTQTQRRLAPTRRRLRRFSNEKIGFWYGGQKVRTINEITYADECGEMQFLRRTLLAGAQKFNEHFPQTLPQMMLKMFRSHINFVGKLYVLGYSFGDAHVDLVLRNWLEFSHHRSMIITDRCRHQLPPQFAHLAPQIEIRRKTASQFFAEYRGVPMTLIQNLEQKVRAKVRPFLEKKAGKKW